MESINLLTNEFTAKSGNVKLARVLKVVGFIGLSIFVIAALILSVTFIVTNRDMSRTKQNQSQLADSIRQIGDVENKYVLVKDRAERINDAQAFPSSEKNIEYFNQFLAGLGDGIEVETIDTESGLIEFTVKSGSINSITNIVNNLVTATQFSDISIESFSFNIESGYTVEFSLNNL